MIILTQGAKLTHGSSRVQPEVLFAITVAERVFENFGVSVEVTTLLGGHSNHHVMGYEVDFSVPKDMAEDIATDLRLALLDNYVVRIDGSTIHLVFTHA